MTPFVISIVPTEDVPYDRDSMAHPLADPIPAPADADASIVPPVIAIVVTFDSVFPWSVANPYPAPIPAPFPALAVMTLLLIVRVRTVDVPVEALSTAPA
jgi:hypothetical protein